MTNEDTKMPEPMSKEEMIDTLKGLVFGTFDRTTAKEREALDMAIKALEQQTCEDCISREQAIRATYGFERYTGIDEAPYEYAESILRDLPSVTPSRPKGVWLKRDYWSEGVGMGETYGYYYQCSECKKMVKGGYISCDDKFCSKCGAEMRESEENDDDE